MRISAMQGRRVIAIATDHGLHFGVGQIRERDVVDLQVAAAGRIESGNRLSIDDAQVMPILLRISVNGRRDVFGATAQVCHRRRRNRELGNLTVVRVRVCVLIFVRVHAWVHDKVVL